MSTGARMASEALEAPLVGAAAEIVTGTQDAGDALNDLDRELENAASPTDPGAPTIPVSCQGNDECAECYEAAYTQLARQRVLLARLQSIYVATHRFAESSQGLGDSIAGLHPQAGVGWWPQKQRVRASLANFDAAYDRHFNNPDWFSRYGYMYLEFMSARYSRPGT
jgi:hypothetical protein